MFQILHAAENILIAELPGIEEGARYLLTKIGDDVRMHRQVNGQQTTSSTLPVAAIDAIYAALHSQA